MAEYAAAREIVFHDEDIQCHVNLLIAPIREPPPMRATQTDLNHRADGYCFVIADGLRNLQRHRVKKKKPQRWDEGGIKSE